MLPIVKGNTGNALLFMGSSGTVLLLFACLRGTVCVSLPRWPSSGVCLVLMFLTKDTAAAAAALHSFVANA